MKCNRCSYENPAGMQVCQRCGTSLRELPPVVRGKIPRFRPGTENHTDTVFHLCLRCGNPVAAGTFTCTLCHWDVRKHFKASSGLTCGSCLGAILIRLVSFVIASGVSLGVGFLSASLGFGATHSTLLTGLISSALSIFPALVKWLFSSLRRVVPVLIAALIMLGALGVNLLPVYAQGDIAEQALNRLMYEYGMEAVGGMQKLEYPGYWVDMRTSGGAYDLTNAAAVLDVGADYGENGGEAWTRESMQQWSNCGPTEESFHGLFAYSFLCWDSNGYVEGFAWGMDNWALMTFNYLEEPELPAADMAEDLYQIMLNLTGSSARQPPTITPTVTKPAQGNAQNQGGTWTQEEISRMAVSVLTQFSQQADGQTPDVIYNPAERTEPPSPLKFIRICEPTHMQNYPDECSSQSSSNSRLRGIVRDKGGSLYTLGCEYPPGTKLPAIITTDIVYIPGGAQALAGEIFKLHASNLESSEEIQFHEMSAYSLTMHHIADEKSWWNIFVFYQEPWLFEISLHSYPSLTLLTDEPELLYSLARQEGLFTPPVSAQPLENQPEEPFAPQQVPPDSNNPSEEELLALLAMLSPAALLPALGITGVLALLDLLRSRSELPPGMVRSPIPGFGPVTPEAARYQRELLEQGYRHDPNTGKFYKPKVRSPLDGTPVSESQAAYEQEMLSQGYVWSGEYGFQSPDDLASLRDNLNRQREYVQSGQAHRDMQKAAQDACRNSAEHRDPQDKKRQYIQNRIDELNAMHERHAGYIQDQINYWDTWSTAATVTSITAGVLVAGIGAYVSAAGTAAYSVQALTTAQRVETFYPFANATATAISEGVHEGMGALGTFTNVLARNAKAGLEAGIGALAKYGGKYLLKISAPVPSGIFAGGTELAISAPQALVQVTDNQNNVVDLDTFNKNFIKRNTMEVPASKIFGSPQTSWYWLKPKPPTISGS